MARKPAPKVEPQDLYEEKVVFVITYVDNTTYGKFVGNTGRVQTIDQAKQFDAYEDCKDYLVDKMLEGVSIMKVWV